MRDVARQSRERLAECFAHALRERDADAALDQVAQAREKAFRAPVLILAIADLRAEQPDVSSAERLVSLGCAIQNLLLAAQARGFASGLSSGRALQSRVLRQAFGLHEGEQALWRVAAHTGLEVVVTHRVFRAAEAQIHKRVPMPDALRVEYERAVALLDDPAAIHADRRLPGHKFQRC